MSIFKNDLLLAILGIIIFAGLIIFYNNYMSPAQEEVGKSYVQQAKTAIPASIPPSTP